MGFGISAKLSELLDNRARMEADAAALKKAIQLVNSELVALVKPLVTAALDREGQTHGTVYFMVDNRTYKAVSSKTVEWSQDALREMAHRMEWEDAEDFFKITYGMAEADYKSILEPTMKAKLTAARTVKYGEPKISIKED